MSRHNGRPRARSSTSQVRRGESTHQVRVSHTTFALLDAIRALPGKRSFVNYDLVVRAAALRLARELGIPLDEHGRPTTASASKGFGLHGGPQLPGAEYRHPGNRTVAEKSAGAPAAHGGDPS